MLTVSAAAYVYTRKTKCRLFSSGSLTGKDFRPALQRHNITVAHQLTFGSDHKQSLALLLVVSVTYTVWRLITPTVFHVRVVISECHPYDGLRWSPNQPATSASGIIYSGLSSLVAVVSGEQSFPCTSISIRNNVFNIRAYFIVGVH